MHTFLKEGGFIITIIEKKNCTGCYACVTICPQQCITMKSDSEGFWYPAVDKESCLDCSLCEKVCPILQKEQVKNEPKAYACYNKNEEIRMKSSSGGLFTLFAEQVIDHGGVVFGAGFDKENKVLHSFVETKEELRKFRGAKYVQSKIGDTYKKAEKFLLQGRQVLFSGTPCQIGGLKSFLQKDYDNLICIDIFCHGVPSPKVWKKYVSYREIRADAPVRNITFRRKNNGWKRYSIAFSFNNNMEYENAFDKDLYMQAFLHNICLRPSCYACNFKTLCRQSDITLADFWGIENMFPEMDDDKGASLVLINSRKGELMFGKILNQMILKEVDINKAVSYNLAAINSVKQSPQRNNFFSKLEQLPFDKLVKKYCKQKISVKMLIRAVLSKLGFLG